MSKKNKVISWILVLLIIFPCIFFPFSGDLAIFIHAGKIISQGGRIYIDFIDLKPPIVYYFFAMVYKIVGNSEIGVRLFDYFWQILVIISLYKVVKSVTSNITLAFATIFVYSISYSILHYSNTMQIESIVALMIVWIMYFQIRTEKNFVLNALIVGILLGVITGFKYTMCLTYGAIVMDDIMERKYPWKKIALKNGINILGILLGLVLTSFPLINPDIRHGFENVFAYLSHYSSAQQLNGSLLRSSLMSLAKYFGDNYSLLFVIATAIAVIATTKADKSETEHKQNAFMRFAFVMAVFLFVSVSVERKFWEYHISRMYVPLTMLTGYGLTVLSKRLSIWWHNAEVYGKVNLSIVLLICFMFSPLPRWMALMRLPYYYAFNSGKYNSAFEREGTSYMIRNQHLAVSDYLNSVIDKKDKVLIMSTGGCIINHFLKTNNTSGFAQSQFYISTKKIPDWENKIRKELQEAQWLAIQTNDKHIFFGHDFSTSEYIKKDSSLSLYINQYYKMDKTLGSFEIYRRKIK